MEEREIKQIGEVMGGERSKSDSKKRGRDKEVYEEWLRNMFVKYLEYLA